MIRHANPQDYLAYAERLFGQKEYEKSMEMLKFMRRQWPEYEVLKIEGLIQDCHNLPLEDAMNGLNVG
jgi:hypothetical protein